MSTAMHTTLRGRFVHDSTYQCVHAYHQSAVHGWIASRADVVQACIVRTAVLLLHSARMTSPYFINIGALVGPIRSWYQQTFLDRVRGRMVHLKVVPRKPTAQFIGCWWLSTSDCLFYSQNQLAPETRIQDPY